MQTPAPGAILRQKKCPIGTAAQAIQQVGEVFVITRRSPRTMRRAMRNPAAANMSHVISPTSARRTLEFVSDDLAKAEYRSMDRNQQQGKYMDRSQRGRCRA
jgi:hypothetical protein